MQMAKLAPCVGEVRCVTGAEAGNRIAADYVKAFSAGESRAFIANLDTSVRLFQWGDYALPMTINGDVAARTYVCSPRATYIDYPIAELGHFPNQALVPALRLLISGVGLSAAPCDVDRIAIVNNWMMSTNLPVALDPALAGAMTAQLMDAFPRHVLAMRSLTWRHSGPLMTALEAAGWAVMPSRQIYLVDDVAAQSLPRRDARRDDKLRRETGLAYEELSDMSDADAARIAELYRTLYIDKHSNLNPEYTPRFIALTHRLGMIRYFVFRDAEGVIQSCGGVYVSGSHATMPVLGYNTAMDREHGLYRLAFHSGSLYAARAGLQFNMSSGAAAFKRNRGAVPEIEYTAFHLGHLPRRRRYPFALLRGVAKYVGIPMLKKYQL